MKRDPGGRRLPLVLWQSAASPVRILILLALAGLAGTAPVARAAAAQPALRILTSDATGVTLRFELPAVQVTKLERPEGRFARIEVADLRAALAVEGRPVLPSESALLGLPPGTIASVRVLEETVRDLT